ncbi:hypothetical protein [Loktanella sp. SALINAS62]|uniref:hypothetical protein n=1 Tax=Loktanella sp. SALINAS62 TaxID=2706124 RepID=UPI001B8C2670|nr:hypothetical protein [Loktanella sp. SALINAS62]MBS1303399.1 hypothetical protein [Loktanella sp. SALINAS62]
MITRGRATFLASLMLLAPSASPISAGTQTAEGMGHSCVSRDAAQQDGGGWVTGTIDGHIINEAVVCDHPKGSGAFWAGTVDACDSIVEISLNSETRAGRLDVVTDVEAYRIALGRSAEIRADISEGKLALAGSPMKSTTGGSFDFDLTFNCTEG